jgi:hypothetical protein
MITWIPTKQALIVLLLVVKKSPVSCDLYLKNKLTQLFYIPTYVHNCVKYVSMCFSNNRSHVRLSKV